MKENKGKGLADEETMQEVILSQPRPATGEKRKTLHKMINMGSLSGCRGHKKVKHGLSKSRVVKLGSVVPPAPTKQPSIQILDLDSSNPVETTLSKPIETIPSKLPRSSPMNLLENEGLAQERLQQVVTDEDVAICYDMSVKEFERSTVHEFFKIFSSS